MAKFLKYEDINVALNGNIFLSNSLSFRLSSSNTAVRDINGNLVNYSPDSLIQGSLSTDFFLTGNLPSFLQVGNLSETPINFSFNGINIPSHISSLSFSVQPFQPIIVSAEFVFFHGLRVLDTSLAQSNQAFDSSQSIVNGVKSYTVSNVTNKDFVVAGFSYSYDAERIPYLRVDETVPSRVALKEVNSEMSISANNIDKYISIYGNSAIFSGVLRDACDASVTGIIAVSGIINNQSFKISDSQYGIADLRLTQNHNKLR